MQDSLFSNSYVDSVSSDRIIYTPSTFARSSLIHLQEIGTLQATHPHKNKRSGLCSCLFFIVLKGSGQLVYDGENYELHTGDCVFIDCKKSYSHETGSSMNQKQDELWSLQWVHFYGPNMGAIYRKYQERGGRPTFRPSQLSTYRSILEELYQIADSVDYVRDMRIHEKLSSLLILLMEDAWNSSSGDIKEKINESMIDIQEVKEYLDSHFTSQITIDELSSKFFINKYYLMKLFKDRYGLTINTYLNSLRITYVKQQLRFTDRTVEELATELQIEPSYLSRLFKKVEGISPTTFRKSWRGK